MKTHTMDKAPTKKKAKFTVDDAARAFRLARGNAKKVELIEGEKEYVRRDDSGRFVLVRKGEAPKSKRNPPPTDARAARARTE
jgi:hypothetical protein